MAKRARAAKKAAARPKAERAEPFFRPFSGLSPARSGKAAKKAAGRDARTPETSAPPAPDATAQPVDPRSFAVYMAGVHALPGDRAHRIPLSASQIERAAPAGARADDADPDGEARARMRSLVGEGLRFETSDDGEIIEGRRIDLDPRELRRLRRGQYAVDGKLDLHGLGAEEARQAVEAFIKKRACEGDRVVLVIHGRGAHSPRGHAVLRGEIAAWLSQGRSSRHVAAFATAPSDALGIHGTGALLVLLAR